MTCVVVQKLHTLPRSNTVHNVQTNHDNQLARYDCPKTRSPACMKHGMQSWCVYTAHAGNKTACTQCLCSYGLGDRMMQCNATRCGCNTARRHDHNKRPQHASWQGSMCRRGASLLHVKERVHMDFQHDLRAYPWRTDPAHGIC